MYKLSVKNECTKMMVKVVCVWCKLLLLAVIYYRQSASGYLYIFELVSKYFYFIDDSTCLI